MASPTIKVENKEDMKEKNYNNWSYVKGESEIDVLEANSISCGSSTELEVGPFEREQISETKEDLTAQEVKIYICTACEYQTKASKNIALHLKTHEKCKYCDYQPSSKTDLVTHSITKHITLNCDLCSYKVGGGYFEALHDHMESNHIPEFEAKCYKCVECDFQTKTKQRLEKHSLSHQGENLRRKQYKTSFKNSQEGGWLKCETCEYHTEFKKKLQNHVKIHKEKKHICEICGMKFVFKSGLEIHSIAHLSAKEVKMYKCDFCTFQTKYKNSLISHKLVHKNPNELNYVNCNFCEFKCLKKYNLRMHLLTHKSEDEVPIFKCDSCDYHTKFRPLLRNHVKTHHLGLGGKKTTIKKRKIEGKTPRRFNRINRTAQPNPICVCDVCGFVTKYKGSLKTHSMVHKTPEQLEMIKCSYNCGFETKYKGTIKMHELTHKDPSEVTMYPCHLCDFKNMKKYNLTMHLLTHKSSDEVEMIKCKGCDYQTKFKSYMKTHLRKKHLIIKGGCKN